MDASYVQRDLLNHVGTSTLEQYREIATLDRRWDRAPSPFHALIDKYADDLANGVEIDYSPLGEAYEFALLNNKNPRALENEIPRLADFADKVHDRIKSSHETMHRFVEDAHVPVCDRMIGVYPALKHVYAIGKHADIARQACIELRSNSYAVGHHESQSRDPYRGTRTTLFSALQQRIVDSVVGPYPEEEKTFHEVERLCKSQRQRLIAARTLLDAVHKTAYDVTPEVGTYAIRSASMHLRGLPSGVSKDDVTWEAKAAVDRARQDRASVPAPGM